MTAAYVVISSDGHESEHDNPRNASLAILAALADGAEMVAAVPIGEALSGPQSIPAWDDPYREALARPWRAERLREAVTAARTVPQSA